VVWEAVPNFSEGADEALIRRLGSGPGVLDVHADADHDRCVVTMVEPRIDRLAAAVFERVALAVEEIDLHRHSGVHPRVGAADVVPLVPLAGAPMGAAVAVAHRLGQRIWRELRVPVFFYAEAADGRRLADIRAGRVAPDLGRVPHPTAGAACVGARRPLVAYNVLFEGLPLAAGRQVAAGMRELPGVQALAFALPGGRTQVSMNLTRPDETGVPAAYDHACELAGLRGVAELVGLCPAAAAGPGCDGGLLEGRIAGLAAGRAAEAAQGEPAARLAAEGRALCGLAAGPAAALEGAERAAALRPLLRGAGLATPDLEALLVAAVRGLRAAVSLPTQARFTHRVDVIDRWLGRRDL
jgi:glutamate formiminotransferase / 5-formyltetrahydrofolate cyclo-ligase